MNLLKYPILIVMSLSFVELQAQQKLHIWDGTAVNDNYVTLMPYIPLNNKYDGMAIIICPGGSYCWHDLKYEGEMVARWLQQEGIAAFILKYRVQGVFNYIFHFRVIFGGHQHPDMILDLQRSMQYLRENADLYGINPEKLGVMGFSAGGHLVMSAACFSSTDFLKGLGIKTKVSLRPDFVVSIYPVVTMSSQNTHRRSRRALLGEFGQFKKKMRDSLSIEKHIPANCPPVFLVNCIDDPIVNYHNSEMLDSALSFKGIPHKYVQYKSGGHGFGGSPKKGTAECREWKKEFLTWIKSMDL